jgi:diguanylate cyclase (GGDEF)-like protein
LRHRFDEEADRARRHKDVFALVILDLDGLKGVNDRLGHQVGDYVIRDTAQQLVRLLRSQDFLCRYAGDEFVAVIQAAPDEAQELVRRVQIAIDKRELTYGQSSLFVGISAGWASFGPDGESLDQLLVAADRLMYADKSRRRAMGSESGRLRIDEAGQYRLM